MGAKHTNSDIVHRYEIIYKPNISKKTKDIISDYWNNIDGYFLFRSERLLTKHSITRRELTKLVREGANCMVTEICSKCSCDYQRKANTKASLYLLVKEIRLCESCVLIMENERAAKLKTESDNWLNLEVGEKNNTKNKEVEQKTNVTKQVKFGDNLNYGDFIIGFSVDEHGVPSLLISGRNDIQFSVEALGKNYLKIKEIGSL